MADLIPIPTPDDMALDPKESYAQAEHAMEDYTEDSIRRVWIRRAVHAENFLATDRKLAPLCNEHGSGSGTRSGCPYCALIEKDTALSSIDLLVGGDNEMHVSLFDCDYDHERVVSSVKNLCQSK